MVSLSQQPLQVNNIMILQEEEEEEEEINFITYPAFLL